MHHTSHITHHISHHTSKETLPFIDTEFDFARAKVLAADALWQLAFARPVAHDLPNLQKAISACPQRPLGANALDLLLAAGLDVIFFQEKVADAGGGEITDSSVMRGRGDAIEPLRNAVKESTVLNILCHERAGTSHPAADVEAEGEDGLAGSLRPVYLPVIKSPSPISLYNKARLAVRKSLWPRSLIDAVGPSLALPEHDKLHLMYGIEASLLLTDYPQ